MPAKCVVYGCNSKGPNDRKVRFHAWPKDEETRELWTKFVLGTRSNFAGPSRSSVICSEHFTEDDYDPSLRLKERLGFGTRRLILPGKYPTILKNELGEPVTISLRDYVVSQLPTQGLNHRINRGRKQPRYAIQTEGSRRKENVGGSPRKKEKKKKGKSDKSNRGEKNGATNISNFGEERHGGAGSHHTPSGNAATRAILKPLRRNNDIYGYKEEVQVVRQPDSAEGGASLSDENSNFSGSPSTTTRFSGNVSLVQNTTGIYPVTLTGPQPSCDYMSRMSGDDGTLGIFPTALMKEPFQSIPSSSLQQSCGQSANYRDSLSRSRPVQLSATGENITIKEEPTESEPVVGMVQSCDLHEPMRDQNGCISAKPVGSMVPSGTPQCTGGVTLLGQHQNMDGYGIVTFPDQSCDLDQPIGIQTDGASSATNAPITLVWPTYTAHSGLQPSNTAGQVTPTARVPLVLIPQLQSGNCMMRSNQLQPFAFTDQTFIPALRHEPSDDESEIVTIPEGSGDWLVTVPSGAPTRAPFVQPSADAVTHLATAVSSMDKPGATSKASSHPPRMYQVLVPITNDVTNVLQPRQSPLWIPAQCFPGTTPELRNDGSESVRDLIRAKTGRSSNDLNPRREPKTGNKKQPFKSKPVKETRKRKAIASVQDRRPVNKIVVLHEERYKPVPRHLIEVDKTVDLVVDPETLEAQSSREHGPAMNGLVIQECRFIWQDSDFTLEACGESQDFTLAGDESQTSDISPSSTREGESQKADKRSSITLGMSTLDRDNPEPTQGMVMEDEFPGVQGCRSPRSDGIPLIPLEITTSNGDDRQPFHRAGRMSSRTPGIPTSDEDNPETHPVTREEPILAQDNCQPSTGPDEGRGAGDSGLQEEKEASPIGEAILTTHPDKAHSCQCAPDRDLDMLLDTNRSLEKETSPVPRGMSAVNQDRPQSFKTVGVEMSRVTGRLLEETPPIPSKTPPMPQDKPQSCQLTLEEEMSPDISQLEKQISPIPQQIAASNQDKLTCQARDKDMPQDTSRELAEESSNPREISEVNQDKQSCQTLDKDILWDTSGLLEEISPIPREISAVDQDNQSCHALDKDIPRDTSRLLEYEKSSIPREILAVNQEELQSHQCTLDEDMLPDLNQSLEEEESPRTQKISAVNQDEPQHDDVPSRSTSLRLIRGDMLSETDQMASHDVVSLDASTGSIEQSPSSNERHVVTKIQSTDSQRKTTSAGDERCAITSVTEENSTDTSDGCSRQYAPTERINSSRQDNSPRNCPSSDHDLTTATQAVVDDIESTLPIADPNEGLVVIDSSVLDLVLESPGPQTTYKSIREDDPPPDGDVAEQPTTEVIQGGGDVSDRGPPVVETPPADDTIDVSSMGRLVSASNTDSGLDCKGKGESGEDAGCKESSSENIQVTNIRAKPDLTDGDNPTSDGGAEPKLDVRNKTRAVTGDSSGGTGGEVRNQGGVESHPGVGDSLDSMLSKESDQTIDDMVDMYLSLSGGERPIDITTCGPRSVFEEPLEDESPFSTSEDTSTTPDFNFTDGTNVLSLVLSEAASLDEFASTERGISSAIASLGLVPTRGGGTYLCHDGSSLESAVGRIADVIRREASTSGGIPATDASVGPVSEENQNPVAETKISMDSGTNRANANAHLHSSLDGEAAVDVSIDQRSSFGGNSASGPGDPAPDVEAIREADTDAATPGIEGAASAGNDTAGSRQGSSADTVGQGDLAGTTIGKMILRQRSKRSYVYKRGDDVTNHGVKGCPCGCAPVEPKAVATPRPKGRPFRLDHPYALHHRFDPANNIPAVESGDDHDGSDDDDDDDDFIDDADKEEYSSDGYNPGGDESDCSENPEPEEMEYDWLDDGAREERPKIPRPPRRTKTKCEDMQKNIFCKLCHFQTPSLEVVCGHLLAEHLDLVAPLQEFLSKTRVGHVGIGVTLHEFLFGNGSGSPTCAGENKEDVESGSAMSVGGDNRQALRGVTTKHILERDRDVSGSEHATRPGDGDKNVDRTGGIPQMDGGAGTGLEQDGSVDSCGGHSGSKSPSHASGNSTEAAVDEGLKHDVNEELVSEPGGAQPMSSDSATDTLGSEGSIGRVKKGDIQDVEESSESREVNQDFLRSGDTALATDIDREKAIMLTGGLYQVMRRYTKFTFHCPRCGWDRRVSCDSFKFVHYCEDTMKNKLCEHCGKTYSKKTIRSHLETSCHRSRSVMVKCTICGKEYTKSRLHNHMKGVHSTKPYTCSICEEQLSSKKTLELHEAKHREGYLFTCPFCQKGFNQKSNMTTHIRQHTGEQPFPCDHCPKAFTNRVCLKAHLKRYHGIDLWKQGQTRGLGRPKKREHPPNEGNKLPSVEEENYSPPKGGCDRSSQGGSTAAAKRRGKRGQKRKHGGGEETRGAQSQKKSRVGEQREKNGDGQGEKRVAIPGEGNEDDVGRQIGEVNRVRRSGRPVKPVKRD